MNTIIEYSHKSPLKAICNDCGENGTIYAKGFCNKCYRKKKGYQKKYEDRKKIRDRMLDKENAL